jgi:hypothetical protein
MRKALIGTLVAFVLLSFTASASQNAGSAWNQWAGMYGFAQYPQSGTMTFAGAYSGSDFTNDFSALLGKVGQTLNVRPPVMGGDDLLNAGLENWPESSGQ